MSLFSPSTHTLRAIWHIDSTGISVMIIRDTVHITHYEYQPFTLFTYDDRHHYEQLLHHVSLIMNRMTTNLAIGDSVVHTTVILGEPWAHTIKRQVTYQRKTPFKLTKSFVDDLVIRDQKKLIHELRSVDPAVLTADLLDPYYHGLSVVGHQVTEPWDRVVNDITIDYTTGFSDTQLINRVKTIIHEKMRVPMLDITIDHFQNFLVLFSKKAHIDQALIIDLLGQTTDLFIIQHKLLVQTGTLPVGLGSIRQRMAEMLNMYPSELDALLSLYARQLLASKIIQKLEKIMYQLFTEWEKDFQVFCNRAVTLGDILGQVIWITDHNDPLTQFFVHTLSQDSAQFPVVFGTAQVVFTSSNSLTCLLDQDIPDYCRSSDQIILSTL